MTFEPFPCPGSGAGPLRIPRLASGRRMLGAAALSLGLAFAPAPAGAACVSNGACSAAAPCIWSDPVTWVGCHGGLPGILDSWSVAPGDTVLYDTTGSTTGSLFVGGTLVFSESDDGRDADGFRDLTIVADGAETPEIACGSQGRIALRRGDRLRFDTTAGAAAFAVASGCQLDLQGTVEQTSVAAIRAFDADVPTCGTTTGRKYVILPASGGPFNDARQRGRRLVFQSGRLVNRHYEIVATSRSTLTVCTDLADGASLGQRLTPHAPGVGAWPGSGAARHTVPLPAAGSAALDPEIGDLIAIVEDVWIDQAAGTANFNFSVPSAGLDPLPIFRAVHLANLGSDGAGNAINFTPRTAAELVPDFEYNNWHDWQNNYGLIWRGTSNFKIRWNHFGGAAANAGTAGNDAVGVHQQKMVEGSLNDIPSNDVEVSHNVFNGWSSTGFSVNDTDSSGPAGPPDTTYRASRITVAQNLFYGGCALGTSSACVALGVHACRACRIEGNVIFDVCRPDQVTGDAISLGGDAPNDGTYFKDNWVVNVCQRFVAASDGSDGSQATVNQKVAFVHNYFSHNRAGRAAGGGRWFGNVIKNYGMVAGNVDGEGLGNPVVAEGNVLVGVDDAVDDVAPCNGVGGCARVGFSLTRGSGNRNATSVVLSDNVVARLRDTNNRSGVHLGAFGGGLEPDYGGTIAHLTVDNQSDAAFGVEFEYSLDPGTAVKTWAIEDLVTTHDQDRDAVRCTAVDAQTHEEVGVVYSTQTALMSDGGGRVSSGCSAAGTVTRVPSPNYVNRLGLDFNLTPGAAQRTAGAQPAGSPVGIRAFRFSRDRIRNLWGGGLTFDGAFPADVANVANADTDEDGVIDLHDDCPGVWDPAQVDLDGDGYLVCEGDCDDANPAAHPGGLEVCDGADNDCNGAVDDGLDLDGDGHSACVDDCDDTNFAVHPGAAEICNGIDDDCDALVDEDAAGVDSDGDGIHNACDNCSSDPNHDQSDLDHDGQGDACDLDDGLILVRWAGAGVIAWQPEAGFGLFNLYRGDLAVLRQTGIYTQDPATVPLAARSCGLAATQASDGAAPGRDEAAFYLVSGVSAAGESGLGEDSGGTPRPNDHPCP